MVEGKCYWLCHCTDDTLQLSAEGNNKALIFKSIHMNKNIAMATGHRPNKLGKEYKMRFKDYGPCSMWVYRELEQFVVYKKPDIMISGMAIGTDMIWATLALRMDIPLWAYIPFEGQEYRWNQETQVLYRNMLALASKIVVVSPGGYANWKFQKRNAKMVDDAGYGIGVYDGTAGGTQNTLTYANIVRKEMKIIDLNEFFNA